MSAGLLRQIHNLSKLADVQALAIMPDVHQGPVVPNGMAIATSRLIYPELVGADIGCGFSAICLEGNIDQFSTPALHSLLIAIKANVPTIMHPTMAQAPQLPELCQAELLSSTSQGEEPPGKAGCNWVAWGGEIILLNSPRTNRGRSG